MEIEVKGHSGCEIEVVREGNEMFVYKSSSDPKYLERLVNQARKQQLAGEPEYQHIRVPKIYEIVSSEGGVRVKMDYVYSRNFVEFFEHAGFEQVRMLIGGLIKFLEREIGESPLAKVSRDVVVDKFNDVKKKVEGNPCFAGDREISEILSKSEVVFDCLPDMEMPVGVCHGDLTFSNILFNGNNYYLIDFLDSFIESPLLDIVKLRQDTAWMWSRLMYSQPCDTIRLHIAFKKIDQEIDRYFRERYEWYSKYYDQLQLMNFLRILQYAHDREVINYLKKSINEQLGRF